jgi:hypothetical protein
LLTYTGKRTTVNESRSRGKEQNYIRDVIRSLCVERDRV